MRLWDGAVGLGGLIRRRDYLWKGGKGNEVFPEGIGPDLVVMADREISKWAALPGCL